MNEHKTVHLDEFSGHQEPYYIATRIIKWSSTQAPCLDISIEGKKFFVELDLGYRGNLAFTKQFADQLSSKTFLKEKPMYGIKGKKYPTKLYQIPSLEIGKITFLNPVLQEEGEEFTKDATFVQEGKELSSESFGRLGWELFCKTNLVVDVKNSLIAFCDGLETLAKKGYKVEEFTRLPLCLDRGLLEIDVETPDGILRCVLDTGATWNMLNCDAGEGKTIDDLMWNVDNIIQYPFLKLNERDFGPVAFHRLPIRIPIRIEAILGMDFFKNHLVFLDFTQKYAYFSK